MATLAVMFSPTMWFAQPWALWLLLVLPWLGLLALFTARWRRRAQTRFGDVITMRSALTLHKGRRHGRRLCLTMALVLLVIGMAGPQWSRYTHYSTTKGRDIVVVLDVSRSMTAEQPSRLERARRLLLDLADTLEQRGGQRLALVIFAGKAKIVCPLTRDYEHFRQMVQEYTTGPLPPEVQPGPRTLSGTRLGAGLQRATESYDPESAHPLDILLISDGDDPVRDGEWLEGVAEARRWHIPVDVVGVGEPQEPSRIPAPAGYLKYEGEEVQTTLNEELLSDIAQRTGGTFIPARTRPLPLGTLYLEILSQRPDRHDEEEGTVPIYRQRYPWFLFPALLFLIIALCIGDGRWR